MSGISYDIVCISFRFLFAQKSLSITEKIFHEVILMLRYKSKEGNGHAILLYLDIIIPSSMTRYYNDIMTRYYNDSTRYYNDSVLTVRNRVK